MHAKPDNTANDDREPHQQHDERIPVVHVRTTFRIER